MDTLSQDETGLIIVLVDGEPRIDSRLIAKELGIEHEVFFRTLRKYQDKFERMGVIRFENGKPLKGSAGGRPEVYAMLSENQCIFAGTLSRNTEQVVEFKYNLTIKFDEYRKRQGEKVSPILNLLWTKRLEIFCEKTRIPDGYWCIFEQVANFCWKEEFRGVQLMEEALPDGSIGRRWCAYAREVLGWRTDDLPKYPHRYPPDDTRGIQAANIYPNSWLGAFHTWFQRVYLKGQWQEYLKTHLRPDGEIAEPVQQKRLSSGRKGKEA